jgi:hypothetical protein
MLLATCIHCHLDQVQSPLIGSDGAAFLKDSKRLKIIYQPVREPRSKLAANTHDDGKRNKKQRNNKQPLKDGRIHSFILSLLIVHNPVHQLYQNNFHLNCNSANHEVHTFCHTFRNILDPNSRFLSWCTKEKSFPFKLQLQK